MAAAHRDAVEEGDAEGELAEQRDTHRNPGKEHRPPGGVDGVHRGVLDGASTFQPRAVAGHDQQGVVDPDPEADEDAEDGGEAGH